MIYTVTFNPSLDYIVGVDEFKTGKVNRTAEELILPGGKGINVSIVLKNLGMESIPLGFAGGFTGEEIHRLLKERKVEEQFVRVKKGISRINVKLRSLQVGENGEKTVSEESEINGMGPEISGEELEIFYQQLDALQKGDILLHGHTHVPACEHTDTFVYLNPGSVSIPKENSPHSYMTLENGEFLWKNLQGEVYKRYCIGE